MTYLGVPLIIKQIGVNNWKVLIDKLKAKVNNWKNRMFSYTERLQLISSKGSQGEVSKGKAKVAWKYIYRSKKEGGLGIKSLGE